VYDFVSDLFANEVLGVEHPDTLISVSNLALVLHGQGKYEAAEEMNRRALEKREKVLGMEHPDTLTSVSNLAEVLRESSIIKASGRSFEGKSLPKGRTNLSYTLDYKYM
jgi:hypothetical protein